MSRLAIAYNDTLQNVTAVGPALDLQTTRGSGQLVIALPSGVPGSYYVEVVVNQAPTVSGPWTPVPAGGFLHVDGPTAPGVTLVPYTRSCRYLQAAQANSIGDGSGCTVLVIEPPPPLALR